jgi:hypothetical protein
MRRINMKYRFIGKALFISALMLFALSTLAMAASPQDLTVETITFNFDPNYPTTVTDGHDAISIRYNSDTPYFAPEYHKSNWSYPVAYIGGQENVNIIVLFKITPQSTDVSYSIRGVIRDNDIILGNTDIKTVSFQAGRTLSSALFNIGSIPTGELKKSSQEGWKWQYYANGVYNDFDETKHTVYCLPNFPVAPWTVTGISSTNHPWVEALDLACTWVNDAIPELDLTRNEIRVKQITEGVYKWLSSIKRYPSCENDWINIKDVGIHHNKNDLLNRKMTEVDLTVLLTDPTTANSPLPLNYYLVECHDTSNIVSLLSSLVGITGVKIREYAGDLLDINKIYTKGMVPIGYDETILVTNNWSDHQVVVYKDVTIEGDGTNEKIFDPCIKLMINGLLTVPTALDENVYKGYLAVDKKIIYRLFNIIPVYGFTNYNVTWTTEITSFK